MKCKKCSNEYPSFYYFASEDICRECFQEMSPEEQQQLMSYNPQDVPIEFKRIGFGQRLGASLLDYLFFFIIFYITLILSGAFNDLDINFQEILINQDILVEMELIMLPYILIITFFYFSLEILYAATPGKMILGLKIADEHGRNANFDKLSLRYIFKHFNTILTLIAFTSGVALFNTAAELVGIAIIIGFFFVLTMKRQAFHDMLAKTAVYHKRDIINTEIVEENSEQNGINNG